MNLKISNLIGEKSAVIADVNARDIPSGIKAAIGDAVGAMAMSGCKLDVHAQEFAGAPIARGEPQREDALGTGVGRDLL